MKNENTAIYYHVEQDEKTAQGTFEEQQECCKEYAKQQTARGAIVTVAEKVEQLKEEHGIEDMVIMSLFNGPYFQGTVSQWDDVEEGTRRYREKRAIGRMNVIKVLVTEKEKFATIFV